MDHSLERPTRFLVTAIFAGIALYLLLANAAPLLPRPWNDIASSSRALLAPACVLGILVPTWVVRRCLIAARAAELVPGAALFLCVISFTITAVLLVAIYATGDSVEEVRMEPTLLRKLLWAGVCILHVGAKGLVAAAQCWAIALPFAWASLLCLRWAGGGRRPEAPLANHSGGSAQGDSPPETTDGGR